MPSIKHKWPIAEEIRKTLENLPIRDMMLGEGKDGDSGLLGTLYQLIGSVVGALETAYRRGYDAGRIAAEKKVTRKSPKRKPK